MKKIFILFSLQFLIVMAFAQQMPCPTVVSSGVLVVGSTGSTCTYKIQVRAQGDVGARKGLRVQAYIQSNPGNLLVDQCFTVPPDPSDSVYNTTTFSAPCTATIMFVITRYTSSNGKCQGGTCGIDTLSNAGGPLPVRLTSFDAKRNNNNVLLVWKTASEENASEFVIQKKQGGTFVDIATVPATNSAFGSNYSYNDINSSKGITEYRIKMVDISGKYANSDIRAIRGTSDASAFVIYPNPTHGSAKITITDVSADIEVQVTDNSGRIVKTINMVNTNTAELNNLQKGMYMIRLVNKATGEVVIKKLTVLN